MTTGEQEVAIFTIISHGGNAKSLAYEALTAAEDNNFEKASTLMKEAEEELNKAHSMQTSLIQSEINGTAFEKSLLMIHAQDHLMTAISEKSLIERMITMHQKMEKLMNNERSR